MKKFLLLFLLIFFVPLVNAVVVVSPQNPLLSVVWYVPQSFSLTVTNNNNFTVSDFTFTPVPSGFTFQDVGTLAPYQSKVISYSVSTNELFTNRVLPSMLSFSYLTNSTVNAPLKSYDVNISSNGVSFIPVLMAGDSIVFRNQLSQSVNLNDYGSSGFPNLVIPAGGVVSRNFSDVKNLSFMVGQLGVLSSFSVVNRRAHDSTMDVPLSFVLSSVLPASTMSVNLLSSNITVNNNATYPQALIEIRNNDPNLVIQNVHINASRWVSNFTPNDFNIPAGGVQRILFDITPFVDRTNLTNRSNNIVLNVVSSNAGSTVKSIDVFINYQNMDIININGVNYTVNFLSINATAEACKQHRIGVGLYDTGFESCKLLEIVVNQTIIKEIPASYDFTEAQVKTYADSFATLGNIAQRLENTQNRYLDKQALTNSRVDNLTDEMVDLRTYVNVTTTERNARLQSMNLRYWLSVSFTIFFLLLFFVTSLLANIELFEAYEKAGQ